MKNVILAIIAITTATMGYSDMEPAIIPVNLPKEKDLTENIKIKNDLRLRYESIERDDAENKYRNRYRLRMAAQIKLIDNLQFEVGMRSGFANPTSGNQTIKDNEPISDYFFQSLRFNILGLTYKTDKSIYKIGKQPYMIYRPIKSQLIWDNDVSLNGFNYQYKDDNKIITLGANQPTLEEKASSKAKDVNLLYAQYVNKSKINKTKVNMGIGFYYYDGLKGNIPLFGSRKGNTLDTNGLYINEYNVLEGFMELQYKDIFGKPFKIAASLAYNIAANENNFGYDLAFKIGETKNVGDWQLKYSYTDLQEDATYGAYSDSDNFGGGTASRGHAIRTKYKMGKNLYLAGNFFINELYESKSKKESIKPRYNRVQLDVIIKF